MKHNKETMVVPRPHQLLANLNYFKNYVYYGLVFLLFSWVWKLCYWFISRCPKAVSIVTYRPANLRWGNGVTLENGAIFVSNGAILLKDNMCKPFEKWGKIWLNSHSWAIFGWGNCLTLTPNGLSDSWQVCIVIATTYSKLQVCMQE